MRGGGEKDGDRCFSGARSYGTGGNELLHGKFLLEVGKNLFSLEVWSNIGIGVLRVMGSIFLEIFKLHRTGTEQPDAS